MLRPLLPVDFFAPSPSRLGWLALHLAIAGAGIAAIAFGVGGWLAAIPLSLLIGHSFGCLAFVAHEALHVAVVRRRSARWLVGFIGFLPFALSPRLWVVWHNRLHHGFTARHGVDPDSFPMLEEWRARRCVRVVERLSMGRRHWLGAFSLFFGFPVQSFQMLWRYCGDRRYFTPRTQALAIGETLFGVALWTALGLSVGPLRFLFAFVIPLLVGGAVVMSYVLTNHALSPLGEVNDPLRNSLSVTTLGLFNRLHLNFGLHVEHHLFPSMSPRRAPALRDLLKRLWPERYQAMPHSTAIARLFGTCRVYRDEATLIDPVSGRTWEALLPGASMSATAGKGQEAPSEGSLPEEGRFVSAGDSRLASSPADHRLTVPWLPLRQIAK